MNVGSLSSVLESLVAQKVVRVVIRFTESAAPVGGYGPQLAPSRGRIRRPQREYKPADARFPARLAGAASGSGPQQFGIESGRRAFREPSRGIRASDAEAVRAALKSAIEVLPREELLAEIETGHPLTRVAALADGGSRLAVEDLPLVLKYADDADPRMQLAALAALRHFGEKPAIEKLLEYARRTRSQPPRWRSRAWPHPATPWRTRPCWTS